MRVKWTSIILCSVFALRVGAQTDPVQPTSLSGLSEEDLRWEGLPSELTRKVVPLYAAEDLEFEVGKLRDGQEYLRILPPKKYDLSFGIRSASTGKTYIVAAKRAFYWPGRSVLRLDREVIVSSTACVLEGKTFDIHLGHETIRLQFPERIEIAGEAIPVEGEAVRISGIGDGDLPILAWEGVEEQPVSASPEASPEPSAQPTRHPPDSPDFKIQLVDRWKILFEERQVTLKELQESLHKIAQENPGAEFVIEKEASVGTSLLRSVHGLLDDYGFKKTKTILSNSGIQRRELTPPIKEPAQEEEVNLPRQKGARLLWIEGPGNFLLNGNPLSPGKLRQTMRRLARVSPDIPVIVAGPPTVPRQTIDQIIQDLRAFGFSDIQVSTNLERIGS